MRVEHDVPLAPLTTLRLGGPARRLVTAETAEEIVAAVRDADEPLLLIAGGSNLVLPDTGSVSYTHLTLPTIYSV